MPPSLLLIPPTASISFLALEYLLSANHLLSYQRELYRVTRECVNCKIYWILFIVYLKVKYQWIIKEKHEERYS